MTDLEKAVCDALRLSDDASNALLSTIQRNISTARAELIRSGVASSVVNTDGNHLVEDAIICFCMAHMADETLTEKYLNVFMMQQENLRKS